ncbi:kinesin motor domain protein [Cooperia oncophora]
MQLFEAAGCVNGDIDYEINVSMIEIYNEKIKDLLAPSGSSSTPLSIRLAKMGAYRSPAVAATELNASSSRSHVIVRVVVTTKNNITGVTTVGRLNLVDLAGSERVSQTNATGQLLLKRSDRPFNKSLSELGNVVLALRQNQKHISISELPTYGAILRTSSNGDSKTLVIVHLSPDAVHCNESASSMSFCRRQSPSQIQQLRTGRAATKRRCDTGAK